MKDDETGGTPWAVAVAVFGIHSGAAFAAVIQLGTLLAVIGLYGVMAYTVEQRTREIGIRVALGAQRRNVVWLVMKEVLAMVGIGFAIGLPAAWLSSRLVASLLYGIQPNDPASIIAAMAVLAGVTLLAGYIPAVRASRVDPLRALHYE